MNLVGYANRFSVPRGSTIKFMVSTELDRYDVDVVRLVQGDDRPEGPGYREEIVPTEIAGTLAGRTQRIDPGSFARVPDSPLFALTEGLTIQAWVYPTTGDTMTIAEQVRVSQAGERSGWSLTLEGRLPVKDVSPWAMPDSPISRLESAAS
jgi:N,N-dimethylformamidase